MESPKTFAEGMKQALELLDFFSRAFTQTYPCRAILLQADTDNRIAPEEIVGKATLTVAVDGLRVIFNPDDTSRATFNVGSDLEFDSIEVNVALLALDSEDIVFRNGDFIKSVRVRPGDVIHLLDTRSGS